MSKKVTLLAGIGAGLEYYDFIIYGMMAHYLGQQFFNTNDQLFASISVFLIFAVGYLARPFGGILFGLFADRHGRKYPFAMVMFVMAFATFAIGLLPTYADIGITAGIVVLLLRLLQGFSFGAELPNAMIIIGEYNASNKRALHSGFIISSAGMGALLASSVLYILTSLNSEQEILDFAWRLPFLFGGLLAFIGYYVRRNVKETKVFLEYKNKYNLNETSSIVKSLIKEYPRQILLGVIFALFPGTMIITNIFLPTFFTKTLMYASKDVYFAMTVSLIWSVLSAPLYGVLSDKIGRQLFFKIIVFLFCIFAVLSIYLLEGTNVYKLIVFLVLYQTFLTAAITNYFPVLVEIFPVNIRCTALAICYNIAYAIAAFVPTLLIYLLSISSVNGLIVTMSFLALTSFLSLLAGLTLIYYLKVYTSFMSRRYKAVLDD